MLLLTPIAILSVSVLDGLNPFKGGFFSLYFRRTGQKWASLACPPMYTLLAYSFSFVFMSLKLSSWNSYWGISMVLLLCAITRIVNYRYHVNLDVRVSMTSMVRRSLLYSIMDLDFLIGGVALLLGVRYFLPFLITNVLSRYLGSLLAHRLFRTNFEILTSISIALVALSILA
ncbi:hypothetical protein GWK48_09730 [Metallosphaera tengchongensis]|uniref:Uncharacterized protein n=1 Tax=Metallosphaera tengchongensis TaxID=1532350 RepID=A0A6N0NUT2_9CREN|nr:hypothetical protein [Metallosphaera tengchongensis]QKR00624.1 hypothetical protein GWK48_09730 [Metallosphaera tengchongensis]